MYKTGNDFGKSIKYTKKYTKLMSANAGNQYNEG